MNPDTLVRNLAELKLGSPVVHFRSWCWALWWLSDTRYWGLKAEYLLINYANESKLYVPVGSLHLISRYVGGSDETAPLHKLGNESWAKRVKSRRKNS